MGNAIFFQIYKVRSFKNIKAVIIVAITTCKRGLGSNVLYIVGQFSPYYNLRFKLPLEILFWQLLSADSKENLFHCSICLQVNDFTSVDVLEVLANEYENGRWTNRV